MEFGFRNFEMFGCNVLISPIGSVLSAPDMSFMAARALLTTAVNIMNPYVPAITLCRSSSREILFNCANFIICLFRILFFLESAANGLKWFSSIEIGSPPRNRFILSKRDSLESVRNISDMSTVPLIRGAMSLILIVVSAVLLLTNGIDSVDSADSVLLSVDTVDILFLVVGCG